MWSQASLNWPDSAQSLETQSATVLNSVSSTMNSASNSLAELSGYAGYSQHPLSSEAAGLLSLRSELTSLLSSGTVLTVSPYQFEVGAKTKAGNYLDAKTAIDKLVQKLRDKADKYRPVTSHHCIAVMLSASKIEDFATNLNQLTQLFTLPEWCMAARYSTSLAGIETTKRYQPAVIKQPRFKPSDDLNSNPLSDYLKWQGAQIATLESLASDQQNVISKLGALASKRGQYLTTTTQKIAALKSLQGTVWSMSLNGNAESLATALSQSSAPTSHPFTITSLILSDSPLTFWEELLCSP
ncbi:hypothetical protein OAP63_14230 [Vibrio sp.]|nr:hypothetical protein [Vibrio sp.]